jgi:hypothetical protein
MLNFSTEKKKVTSKLNKLNAENVDGIKGAELKDIILRSEVLNDRYGTAFWDTVSQKIVRIYYPAQPEKKPDETYFSSYDEACHIISNDNGRQFEYMMPSGVFYADNWFFDHNKSRLNFIKILPYDKRKKLWNFYIINIELFEH